MPTPRKTPNPHTPRRPGQQEERSRRAAVFVAFLHGLSARAMEITLPSVASRDLLGSTGGQH
jgi:hypothetical protein